MASHRPLPAEPSKGGSAFFCAAVFSALPRFAIFATGKHEPMTQHDSASVDAPQSAFRLPRQQIRGNGEPRCVGFELEFSGLSVSEAAAAAARGLGARAARVNSVEYAIEHDSLGHFGVEVDWRFLKERARAQADSDSRADIDWTEILGDLASLVVPIEVVCPPVAMQRLDELAPMVNALRDAGAVGTAESPVAAYGVHINTEIPRLDAQTVHRYLRAFCLLQWWLLREHDIDTARRLSPYVTPYPEAYLLEIHALHEPTLRDLLDHYLEHNATRNRALDMLPLFAVDAPKAVKARVDDPRIQARPAFHYRLPDCHIERSTWSLALPWARWCVVEALADDEAALADLAQRFSAAKRPLVGVDRSAWIEEMDTWLSDRASA